MKCPRCGSEKVSEVNVNFPHVLECKKCKYIFLKSPKALIDE
jgi:transcription elongation factor Elf1